VTVVLVTHFLEEAERLCDRVAVMDRGRVVALDSPEGLKGRFGGATTPAYGMDEPGSLETAYLAITDRQGWE
jgi:ABC-2 type transport system ATP-binding protein